MKQFLEFKVDLDNFINELNKKIVLGNKTY